jgi:chemotaxis protein methyltransferase CheR
MSATTSDIDYVRELVRREAAIVLDESKGYLIDARLSPVSRRAGLESISALVEQLKRGASELQTLVVEALTTNETSFFRDVHPFEALATEVLPSLARARSATRSLRIWSAASSTGQEAYTMAMVIDRVPQLAGWNVRIVGTDLSEGVLAQAREGRYAQLEVNRGLPVTMLTRYFDRDGIAWRIKPEVHKMVEFKQMNLVRPWPPTMRFDIVFLRNVLIYFDATTKQMLLDRVLKVLPPDGYLFVGGTEMIAGAHDGFIQERSGRATWHRPK